MAKRPRKSFFARTFERNVKALTASTLRVGSAALRSSLKPATVRRLPATDAARGDWLAGIALGPGGARRYRLFRPHATAPIERLPLLVMLHGCGQDAAGFALSTRMNRLAASQGFCVLYPEQDAIANPQRCWNWFDTRSGRADAEAALLMAAIDQVSRLYRIDAGRVAVAGLSAGAAMAALLALRHPARFCAVAMHSGVPPGMADSTATALAAMRGQRHATALATTGLPPLLVIHGSRDGVVAVGNAHQAAKLWSDAAGAAAGPPRQVQRGQRHPMTVTDFKRKGRLAASLCEVATLGHAWSGGAASEAFSDAKGPDASRLIWAFVARQLRQARRTPATGLDGSAIERRGSPGA